MDDLNSGTVEQHKGYSPEEQQAYKDQAGRKTFSENSIDMTGNARAFAKFPVSADPDIRDGVKTAPDYNHPYVKERRGTSETSAGMSSLPTFRHTTLGTRLLCIRQQMCYLLPYADVCRCIC